MCTGIQSIIVYSSQDMEAVYASINWWMDKVCVCDIT